MMIKTNSSFCLVLSSFLSLFFTSFVSCFPLFLIYAFFSFEKCGVKSVRNRNREEKEETKKRGRAISKMVLEMMRQNLRVTGSRTEKEERDQRKIVKGKRGR